MIKIFKDLHQYDIYIPAIASSYRIDKPGSDTFKPGNICDKKETTAWCTASKDGIDEYIYIHFRHPKRGPMYEYYSIKPMKIKISIINGYSENLKTYREYNRIKKATFEVFEGSIALGQDKIRFYKDPILNTQMIINLEDTSKVQTFYMEVKPMLYEKYKDEIGPVFSLIGKFTIKEVYKGEKYPYSCLSEILAEEIYN